MSVDMAFRAARSHDWDYLKHSCLFSEALLCSDTASGSPANRALLFSCPPVTPAPPLPNGAQSACARGWRTSAWAST